MRFDPSMFLRGYNPTPIEPESNALMRGLEMQRVRQGNALNDFKLQAAQQEMQAQQQAMQRQAMMEQRRKAYLGSVNGQAGPTAEFNALQAFSAGFNPAEIKALAPQPLKPYSLSPGGRLVGPDGRTIAEAPFKPEPQKLPPLADLQAYRETLPPNDPRRREVQGVIDNQTRPPKFATPGADAPKPPKPLPPVALKMQQESLDKIGIAASINADLAGIEKQIDGGKLKFGPVSNLANAGLNMAGLSTEESRNFASFKSTLERLRNESLRLNTGVQTDGDAQRAWNELFQNINDTGLVKQRLAEIQAINKRGADLQALRVDSIRNEFGVPALDASQYATQPSAIGSQGGPYSDGEKERRYQEWKAKQK